MGRYIILDVNNKVIATRVGPSIVEGEIESEFGECGQIMQPDGTFIDDPNPPTPEPIPAYKVHAECQNEMADLNETCTQIAELVEGGT